MKDEAAARRFEGASESVRRLNPHIFGTGGQAEPQRLRASEPQQGQGRALVRPAPRKAKGDGAPAIRYRVRFIVYACQPCDWDNYFTKHCQDCLVAAGLLPDDNWRILEGEVISRKARTRIEQRTVIEIWKIDTETR